MTPIFSVALLASTILPTSLAIAAEPKPAPPKQITNSIGMKLTLILSGEFMMGSKESAEETAAFFNKIYGEHVLTADDVKDEYLRRRVRITQPFYLGTCHVARGQFRHFVNETGYNTDAEKGEKPGAYGWSRGTQEFRFNERESWRNVVFLARGQLVERQQGDCQPKSARVGYWEANMLQIYRRSGCLKPATKLETP